MVRNIKHSRSEASALPSRSSAPPATSYYYDLLNERTGSPLVHTPSALDDQFNPQAIPSRTAQDYHALKDRLNNLLDDARNARRRSGTPQSARAICDLMKKAIRDTAGRDMASRSMYMTPPGAHDGTYDFELPYRSPLDRLCSRAEQDAWSRAELLQALRLPKGEDRDQDLRPRDEWRAEPSPLPPMPHEYSYQSRYPRLRTDRAAPTSAAFPSIWSSKLPPIKGSSPEVLHNAHRSQIGRQIRLPKSGSPDIHLVVIDIKSGEKFTFILTREILKLVWPRSEELCRSEDGGLEDFEAVRSLVRFTTRGFCDTPFTGHALDHYCKVMTLAASWETLGLETEAWNKITSAVADMPSAELYRLADLAVSIQNDPAYDPSLRRVNGAIFEAVADRGGELLGDGGSLRRLAAGDGAPLRRLARHMAARLLGSEDAVDDTDESVAGIWTPGTTPPGRSSPASRSMRAHLSDKDHWASVGSKCYCEECMTERRIARW
ncbi:hypothetical protein LTR35_010980 [Friedmanniomyces endolithicus]|uniref:Uncharacterized protein n=1 Tax=Friedmanniomyces endolithicus TaxID=329885 RepID=A0AAN6J4F3_9PEZI|nr:hypothetical protein LTR35_010980 [Friedmanniomyces endolithicus]KAK0316228.1 hypothetical protein LTR82_012256 [Friedmanniomyces endolithicus]